LRASTQALSLLAGPLNVEVLRALEEEPRSLIDLRREIGFPPQTTMRAHLRRLERAGVLERNREAGFPGSVDYALSPCGQELGEVARGFEHWLEASPHGSCPLGSSAAKSVLKALAGGWSAGILRAIGARPMALTELSRLISSLNYPSLERRLAALRLAGLIEASPGSGRGRPYRPSEWLRRAVGPLTQAAAWERRHLPGAAIGRIDVEAAFLLAIPLLHLPEEISGFARLAVEVPGESGRRLAGVMVEVREGEIASCLARLEGQADGWACGSAGAWLEAVVEGEAAALEVGGDCELAGAMVEGLHRELFAAAAPGLRTA